MTKSKIYLESNNIRYNCINSQVPFFTFYCYQLSSSIVSQFHSLIVYYFHLSFNLNVEIVIDTHKIFSIYAYIIIRNFLVVLIIMSMLTSSIFNIRFMRQHSRLLFEIRYSIFVHQYLQYRTVLSVFDIIRHITGATEFDSIDTLCIYSIHTYVHRYI